MRVTREASYRKQDTKTVIKECSPQLEWQSWKQELILEVEKVPNGNRSSTHHDYQIVLNHDDVVDLVKAYAENALDKNPEAVHKAFSDNSLLLQRLSLCALGYDVGEIKPLAEE